VKVLLITEFFPYSRKLQFTGGVEARTFYIAKYLSKKNKVMVICRKPCSDTKTEVSKVYQNIKIIRCGTKVSNIEANFFSIFERIIFIFSAFIKGLSLNFDVVEGSNFVTYLPAYFLGFLKGKPCISWWPDVLGKKWVSYFGMTGIFGQLIEFISLKLPWSKVIALSQSTKFKLIKFGVNKNKINVIYGGVEFEKLNSLKIQKLKKKNIICISRLVSYKRVDDLIKAFSLLVKKHKDVSLIIIGQGPKEKVYKKLVGSENLKKRVVFLKNISRDRLLQLLKQSYIFCLPSLIEGFGLATVEAAACGIPYVIADIKVNKEITFGGQGGLVFKKKNINDLKRKIELLIEDKNLYIEKKKEGLVLAKRYQWRKIAEKTEKIYSLLI